MLDLVNDLTTALITQESRVKDQSHMAALSALIAFFLTDVKPFIETGMVNRIKWAAVRKQLENTWPELTNTEPLLVRR